MTPAMLRPTEFAATGPDLRVALCVDGSWDYEWQDSDLGCRIRVDSCGTGLNQDFPRATLSVDLGGMYAGDGSEIYPQLGIGSLYSVLTQGTEVCVYAVADSSGLPRRFLFHGYAVTDRIRASENALQFEIICTSILEWVGRQKGAWICGRWYYDRVDDEISLVPAMPCIFNRNNAPNRSPNLWSDAEWDNIPVFTDDSEEDDQPAAADAKFWTYADAIKYLITCHSVEISDDGNTGFEDILALIDGLVVANAGPKTLVNPANATLKQILQCKVEPLAVEGGNVIDALLTICKATGICLQQWTDNLGDDEPFTAFLMHLAGDGGPWADSGIPSGMDRTLRTSLDAAASPSYAISLEAQGASAVGRTAADFLAANSACKLEVVRDSQNVIDSCRMIGDVPLVEMSLGIATNGKGGLFVPGWIPDTTFGDNLTGTPLTDQVVAIKALAGVTACPADAPGSTMFSRYVAGGTDYNAYRSHGRLWVFNEDGYYDAATYARSGGVFVAGAYTTPLLLTWVDRQGTTHTLAHRRRRILHMVTRDAYANRLPPLVEVSWDSGSHWYPFNGHRFLYDRMGIMLTDENLAAVTNEKKPASDTSAVCSIWEAIVNGTFRIAVTCGVEVDTVVTGDEGAGGAHHADYRVHDACQVEIVDTGHSRAAGITSLVAREVDDAVRAGSLAKRALATSKAKAFGGSVIIPWLSDTWRPGDGVSGVQPVGVSFLTDAASTRVPQVWAVQWVNSLANQLTHVTIGDARTKSRPSAGTSSRVAPVQQMSLSDLSAPVQQMSLSDLSAPVQQMSLSDLSAPEPIASPVVGPSPFQIAEKKLLAAPSGSVEREYAIDDYVKARGKR